ncbi:hypothetical protein SASPL_116826 [Salvia splendens]|uniref:Uncharacterized protein n=1 Tax=Salvia splendens TaxID=180675 RepID=A0A8X8ZVR2_SALSN|nr:hypothetical protein SASPL_116826 [Salvia splendens]
MFLAPEEDSGDELAVVFASSGDSVAGILCICIIYEDNTNGWDEKSICSVDRARFVSDGMADPASFDIDQVECHSVNLF